ncbi:MAG: TlpA disulfide reductase family protein [Desulfohalobiaceae bacterium]
MYKCFRISIAALIFFICLGLGWAQAAEDFEAGDKLPRLQLELPEQEKWVKYLGLEPGQESFSLGQIQGRILVLQVFSMYCPVCQKEAPEVNKLFDLLQEQGLQDSVKILGLGAGNTELEVEVFQEKFEIEFPLFADPDYEQYEIFGEVGTPFFLVLEAGSEQPRILFTHLGGFENPEAFLQRIRQAGEEMRLD